MLFLMKTQQESESDLCMCVSGSLFARFSQGSNSKVFWESEIRIPWIFKGAFSERF